MTDQIFAHITATAVRFEENGDYDERHGWVDYRDYPGDGANDIDLHDDRNYAAPMINESLDSEDLADEVRELIGGPGVEGDGAGTFYLPGAYEPYRSAWVYTFEVHFKRKTCRAGKWVELPWDPVHDGGIEI